MKILSMIIIALNIAIYFMAGAAIENEGKKEATLLYFIALLQLVPVIYLIN